MSTPTLLWYQTQRQIRGLAALVPKKGLVEVDFGAMSGGYEASVAVAFPSVSTVAPIACWVQAKATADHSADEHRLEPIRVAAGGVTPGVGFTVYAWAAGPWRLYGAWSVGWAYYGT